MAKAIAGLVSSNIPPLAKYHNSALILGHYFLLDFYGISDEGHHYLVSSAPSQIIHHLIAFNHVLKQSHPAQSHRTGTRHIDNTCLSVILTVYYNNSHPVNPIILTPAYSKWVACGVKGEGSNCKTSLLNFMCQLYSTCHLFLIPWMVEGPFLGSLGFCSVSH